MTQRNKDWLTFLYGVGTQVQVQLVGNISLTEIVCVMFLPFAYSACQNQLQRSRLPKLIGLASLWLLSAVATDFFWRQTEWSSALKGLSAIVVLISAMVCGFFLLWDDYGRLKYFIIGGALSWIITLVRPTGYMQYLASIGMQDEVIYSFSVYYVAVLTSVINVWVALMYRRLPTITAVLIVVTAVFSLINGSRGVFLCTMAGGLLAGLGAWRFRTLLAVQRNAVVAVVLLLVCGQVAGALYKKAALEGWMGEEALRKYEKQSSSKLGLLSGRREVVAGLMAVRDSPLFGHGSWPSDKNGYMEKALEFFGDTEDLEMWRVRTPGGKYGYIPAHSHVMYAWVWHGLLGAVFWVYVFVFVLRFMREGVHLHRPLLAWCAITYVMGLWNIIFSPFSARAEWGIELASMCVAMMEVDRRRRMWRAGAPVIMSAPWDGHPVVNPW